MSRCSLASKPTSARVDLLDDGVDRLLDALAEVAALVAVTALDGLEGAGRGAATARPRGRSVPSSRATSTSTVGLPRESRISRAPISSMLATWLSCAGAAHDVNGPVGRARGCSVSAPCALGRTIRDDADPRAHRAQVLGPSLARGPRTPTERPGIRAGGMPSGTDPYVPDRGTKEALPGNSFLRFPYQSLTSCRHTHN